MPGYLSVLSLPCIYRDLKSANVFLSETNCIKIGDLGVAKLLAATRAMAKTQIGTPYYVSPELWKNKPYNAKSDIWALGCLLCVLCLKCGPAQEEGHPATDGR